MPSQYRNCNLYGGYKVVMTDYHGESPYEGFNEHKMNYKIGYRAESQRTIGELPEKINGRSKAATKVKPKRKAMTKIVSNVMIIKNRTSCQCQSIKVERGG